MALGGESLRQRYERFSSATRTWEPGQPNRRPLVCWEDLLEEDLGPDPTGQRFQEIADRMLGGRYYPPDAIEFFGPWQSEDREIRTGDRILQRARLFPFSRWPGLWGMVEVVEAQRTQNRTTMGYVTTRRHFGVGFWKATVSRKDDRLHLRVEAITGPGSFLFWLGLPIARWLQMRAWRRAVEEFRRL